ncbi:MAG: DUF3828 domain-containing protein, partial [Anaerolineales bacterium]|nr:DUF3828 domain-containing protein [Anaerolineales bacterium]
NTAVLPAPGAPVEPERDPPVEPERDPPLEQTPQEVTEAFYGWYLDSIGDRGSDTFVNPLVAGLYRDSDYLTADFVRRIDETLAGFANGGYDPILLAQDIPERIAAQAPAGDDGTAIVVLLRYWGGNPEPSPMNVHLVRENGRWLIDGVSPFEFPDSGPELATDVVRGFYAWYLDYIGIPGTEDFHNPMSERAYRGHELLADSFEQHIDELLDSFYTESGGAGYDPFLCAQDVPVEIWPDVSFERNGMASVVVRSSFPNHMLTVDLRPEGESWLITNITCAHDPAGIAKTFYTWYLGYIGDRAGGEFRNPLVDGAYRDVPLLGESFVQQVDETLAGFEQGGFDPFLLAQDIPQDFSVDPGVVEHTAVVHLQFGPDCVRHLLVTLDGRTRRIIAIAEDGGLPAEAPDTGLALDAAFVDAAYGFSFDYPADWVLEPLAQDGPGMPDDWPVEAAWLLMPADVAAQLGGGPPDPNAPVIVAPFNVEVIVGDAAAVERVYYDFAAGETAVINGYEATVLQRDPGYTHIIFAHPLRADTWVVFTNWVTGFPGREAQADVATPLWEPLLGSVQFTE